MVVLSQKNGEKYAAWLEEVQELSANAFECWSDWYSFKTAFADGRTPLEAFNDCKEWMEA